MSENEIIGMLGDIRYAMFDILEGDELPRVLLVIDEKMDLYRGKSNEDIAKELISMSSYSMQVEVAKLIWEIAGRSAEHGNAIMDVLGEEAYLNVMKLQREQVLEQEAQS